MSSKTDETRFVAKTAAKTQALKQVRLLLVAPDNRLTRAVRAADPHGDFEPVRLRSFEKALEKAETSGFPIVQWTVDDVLRRLAMPVPRRTPFFVFCPDLPGETVAVGEEIRFALLQYGATAVFSQLRKLPRFLDIVRHHARRWPEPEKHWSVATTEALPWKANR